MPALNVDPVISLGQNIAFLLCLPLVCHFLWQFLRTAPKRVIEMSIGVAFALIAIIGMLSPLHVVAGLFIDGRVAIIAVAGLYSTPTGIIAAVLIAGFRLALGGVGTPSAVATIFTAALIGIAARKYFSTTLNQYQFGKLLVIGLALVIVTAVWAFVSPFSEAWLALQTNILPITVWYPTCTVLLGNLFAQEFIRQDIERALHASSERYLSIVNDQLDRVVRWQADGTITFANDAYGRFVQKTQRDLIGHSLFALFTENNEQDRLAFLEKLTPHSPIHNGVQQYRTSAGVVSWLEWTDRAFFDAGIRLREVQSVGRDITALKQAETQLKYQSDFQSLFLRLATRLINVPSDHVSKAISETLKEIGLFLEANRCAVQVLDETDTHFTRAFEWHQPGMVSRFHMTSPVTGVEYIVDKLRRNEDVLIADMKQTPELQSIHAGEMADMQAAAFAPIFRDNRLVGAVNTNWDHPTRISPETFQLLRVMGEIYLNATDRARQEEQIRKLNTDLEQRVIERTLALQRTNQHLQAAQEAERTQRNLTQALLDSALILTSSLQLDVVVQHILTNLQRVTQHDVATIMILEGDYGTVLGQSNNIDGTDYVLVRNRLLIKDEYYHNLMLQTRQPVILGDISADPKFVRISRNHVIRSFLGLPILAGQEVIGFLNLGSQQADFYTEAQISYLQIFAVQAGIAIQNARLYKQAKTIAALEERNKLARDLHDSVTQTLFAANSIAEALPQLLTINPEKVRHYIYDLHQLTRGAMAEMRSLLVELRPEALIHTELGVLLSQLCDVFTGKTQIEVEKKFAKTTSLQPDTQVIFYRIAQETLNNIAKHAQASKVSLTLYSSDGFVEMQIKDNGCGFDPEQISANHFGLKIMAERAAEIAAQFILKSGVNQGTQIILRGELS